MAMAEGQAVGPQHIVRGIVDRRDEKKQSVYEAESYKQLAIASGVRISLPQE